ncbi:uncharacterized protein LOC115792328 [Archocentrus centrarchus]|uniref:uncharacterized protein LOC115792328 n=1 Tax=Archocentrus centrarchus TaxID=63155 RepID=UPI0011EA27F0|nr:uncharacterized protein LOC115792328 [Archocentrus centrarchus]
MPVIQKPEAKMFFESANLQRPRHHHEFFLRSRPYRGEPPTVAGFLLYPDTPAKMETTSREAFCFRPIPHQDTGKGSPDTQQGSHPSPLASSRKIVRGNKDREVRGNEQEGNRDHTTPTALKNEQETCEMQSQYQKDFPPPSCCLRRRTPAFPQPDNIGINPAFRIDFSTVQRETYPGWPIMTPRYGGRPRAASCGQPNITSQW